MVRETHMQPACGSFLRVSVNSFFLHNYVLQILTASSVSAALNVNISTWNDIIFIPYCTTTDTLRQAGEQVALV